MAGRKGVPLIVRLADRIDAEGPCWEWIGTIRRNGYGTFQTYDAGTKRTTAHLAHRIVYTELVGPIAAGLDLDHLCRNRRCVNPDHLEPVTRAENLRRASIGVQAGARQRARTECAQGHPFTPDNTFTDRRGWRSCRECRRSSDRRYKAKEQAA